MDDTVVFRLKLHKGHKFQERTKQEFLQSRDIEIKAIQTNELAVVASSPKAVQEFKQYIHEYQSSGRNKTNLQYIDEITPYQGFDKNSQELQEELSEHLHDKKVLDVQLMLLPNCTKEQYERALSKIRQRIEDSGARLKREPFFLSDDTPILRVEATPMQLSSLQKDGAIYRTEQTHFFHFEQSGIQPQPLPELTLDPEVDMDSLDTVVVIDSGIDFSQTSILAPFILEHWVPENCSVVNASHGTQVASRVILGENIEQQVTMRTLTPHAKVIDACVFVNQGLSEDQLILWVKEIVETYHERAKIFNMSLNADRPIQPDRISLIAYEIDNLMRKYGVVFVNSAGNHRLWMVHDTLDKCLDDDDVHIASPAESLLAITVGAVNDKADPDSLTQQDGLSPYSRTGPGFAGNEKPDLVAYGGNISTKNQSLFGTKVVSDSGECVSVSGTSFSAPVVSGYMAALTSVLPPANAPMIAKALLLHRAEPQYDYERLQEDEISFYKKLYGHGYSSFDKALSSTTHSVTFVAQGELNRMTKHRVKFYVPEILANNSGSRSPAVVTVTSLVLPPLDHTKGMEYMGAYVSASLHKKDKNDNLPVSNPAKTQSGRKKWQPTFHFKKSFCRFQPGDWEVWLELFTRWDTDKLDNIPYVLAITIEDPAEKTDIYAAIQQEVPNRYQPLIAQEIQLPVRQRLAGM